MVAASVAAFILTCEPLAGFACAAGTLPAAVVIEVVLASVAAASGTTFLAGDPCRSTSAWSKGGTGSQPEQGIGNLWLYGSTHQLQLVANFAACPACMCVFCQASAPSA